LYLDADIIVTGSILDIINTDLNNKYLAAVENPGFNRHKDLGMNPKSRYFNSGVMLLNLDMWRRSNLKVRVVDLIKEKNEAIHFVDQCGLNGVVDGEWIDLDARYNYQSSMLNTFEDKGDSAHQNPVIVHFTGSSKPWQIGDRHPYKKLYWHFRNQTPYRNHWGDFFCLLSFASLITPNFFKGYVKRIIGGKL
jgi:lipopolysaccharide biosynthesis glycosyltransferase